MPALLSTCGLALNLDGGNHQQDRTKQKTPAGFSKRRLFLVLTSRTQVTGWRVGSAGVAFKAQAGDGDSLPG